MANASTGLGPSDLQAFMAQNGVLGEIIQLDTPTPTVEAAAGAVGGHPDQIVKSILFLINGDPLLAITCGSGRVDRRAVAAYCGVGRKRAKLAPPEIVLQLSGYEVGAMPPFGHLEPIRTLLDPAVLEKREVYAGGGAGNALVRLSPQEILRVTGAQVIKLRTPSVT